MRFPRPPAVPHTYVVAAVAVVALGVVAGCGSSAKTSSATSPTTQRPPLAAPYATLVPAPGSETVVGTPAAASPTSSWTSYHADNSRTAAVGSSGSLAAAKVAWTTNLGARVYGQPLVFGGRVFAAAENDRVAALDPATGKVLWSTTIGVPLTGVAAAAGCGNVDPLGITSTPAIDTGTGTLYAVGEVVAAGGAVHRQLVGLDVATGTVKLSDDVDPPLPAGDRAVSLLQRASLAIANGRVYVSFGGQYGDCGQYHGWVVAVRETGPPELKAFEVASDGQGGAVWQSGGAPAVDAAGDIYVSTGNANPDPPQGGPDPKLYTESVVKLSPTLTPLASFKDRVAGGDEDLSTGNPVLLPGGNFFAVGKTDIGYILRRSDLTQVAAIPGICGSDPDGGPAYDQATNQMFVPCRDGGVQVVDLGTHQVTRRLSGANGPPILVGGNVWAVEYPTGSLVEWSATRGTVLQKLHLGAVATFASPSSALGLLLVPTAAGVTAVKGS